MTPRLLSIQVAKPATYGREDAADPHDRLWRTGYFKMPVSGPVFAGQTGLAGDGQLELIPYMLVVGPRDAEQGTVSVRDRLEGDLGAMPLDQCLARLQKEIADKTVRKTYSGTAAIEGKAEGNEY